MSQHNPNLEETLPPSSAQRIRDACARFEAAWKSGAKACISHYSTERSEPERSALLSRLLLIELKYRGQFGEKLDREQYHKLFPDHLDLIDSVFVSFQSAPSLAETLDRSIADTEAAMTREVAGAPVAQGDRFGRFQLIGELGRGAFGAVYRAYDPKLDREVALKFPRAGTMVDEHDVQRFMREARSAAQLRHPNIVPVYDAGEIDGTYYIASAFVVGKTLRDVIKQQDKLSHREAAALVAKLAEALHFAHLKGIIHRDVKPENVMIDETGQPHVMDFGLARRDEGEDLRTREGAQMGTPAYMSPEQARGASHLADARSDLWSLGITLYELLSGTRPFRGHAAELLRDIMERDPEPLRRHGKSISRDLQTICLKCLAKEPDQRYPSCQHLADELERWLRREPVLARPVSRGERTLRWVRRNPVITTLLVLVIASLIGGTIVSASYAIQAHEQAHLAQQEAAKATQNATKWRLAQVLADSNAARAERNEVEATEIATRARQNQYLSDINLTQQLLESGDVLQSLKLLETHRPQLGESDLRNFEWYYLWKLCHSDLQTVSWDEFDVRCVAWSPDGTKLAVGGGYQNVHEIRLLDAATREQISTFKTPKSIVNSVAYSADGRLLASGGGAAGTAGELMWWDAASGEQFGAVHTPAPIMSIAFSADSKVLATGSAQLLQGNGTPVDRYFDLPSGPRDGGVRLWDLGTGMPLATLPGETGNVFAIACSPDGKTLASGNATGTVKLWSLETLEELAPLHTNCPFVWQLAFSPDCQTLAAATGSWNSRGAIELWNMQTRESRLFTGGHRDGVTCVAFSADGSTLASGGWDRTIRLWELETDTEVASLYGHTGYVWSLSFAQDSDILASGSWISTRASAMRGELKVWNLREQRSFVTVEAAGRVLGHYDRLTASAGGSVARVNRDRETVTIWDAATAEKRTDLQGRPRSGGVRCIDISPDGSRIATAGFSPVAKLWDAHSGNELFTLKTNTVPNLTFSPDGRTLATAGDDGVVRLWDVASGDERLSLKGHTDVVFGIDFSPDSQRVVSGSWDNTTKVWDANSGRLLLTFKGQESVIWETGFLNDGRTIVSGSGGNIVGLWDGQFHPDVKTEDHAGFDRNELEFRSPRPVDIEYNLLAALAYERRGAVDTAETTFRRLLRIVATLHDNSPRVPHYRMFLSERFGRAAYVLELVGRDREAELLHIRALSLAEEVVANEPENAEYHGWLGYELLTYALLLAKHDKWVDARLNLDTAVKHLQAGLKELRYDYTFIAGDRLAYFIPLTAKEPGLSENERHMLAGLRADQSMQFLKAATTEDQHLPYCQKNLNSARSLDPLRERDDFKALVQEVERRLQQMKK